MSADASETPPEPEIPETPVNDPSQGDDEPGHTTVEDIDADDSSRRDAEGEKVSDGAPEDLEVPVDGDQGTGMPGAEADGDGAPEESADPIDSGSSDRDESGHATAGDIDAVDDADGGDAGSGEIASAEELAVSEKGAVATRREGDLAEHRAQEDDVALDPPEAAAPTEEAQVPETSLVEAPAQDASESTEAPEPESADEDASSENPIPGEVPDQESPDAADQADAPDPGEIAEAEPSEQAPAASEVEHSAEARDSAAAADSAATVEPTEALPPEQPSAEVSDREEAQASSDPDHFDAATDRSVDLDRLGVTPEWHNREPDDTFVPLDEVPLMAQGSQSGGEGGNSSPPRGVEGSSQNIDESEKVFSSKERRIAEHLQSEGKNVKALKESTTPGQKTPDSLVDGVPTEFKTLQPGASPNSVKNALNTAKKQAQDAVVDARGSGLGESGAQEGMVNFLRNNPPNRMKSIRIIGDDYIIRWP